MCTGCYKARFGTIIELRLYGDLYVAKASILFDSWKNINAAVVEPKAFAAGTTYDTRQQLFDSLPVLRPMSANGTSLMRPAVAREHFEGTSWGSYAT